VLPHTAADFAHGSRRVPRVSRALAARRLDALARRNTEVGEMHHVADVHVPSDGSGDAELRPRRLRVCARDHKGLFLQPGEPLDLRDDRVGLGQHAPLPEEPVLDGAQRGDIHEPIDRVLLDGVLGDTDVSRGTVEKHAWGVGIEIHAPDVCEFCGVHRNQARDSEREREREKKKTSLGPLGLAYFCAVLTKPPPKSMDAVAEYLRCPVCFETAVIPLVCPGGAHVVCQACHLEYLSHNPGMAEPKCTVCQRTGSFTVLPLVNWLTRLFPRVEECELCRQTVNVHDMDDHLNTVCSMQAVPCKDCGFTYRRKDLARHECTVTKCPDCGKMCSYVETHRDFACDRAMTRCRECGARMPRHMFWEHMDTEHADIVDL
jgi:hypothetical protein